MCGPETVCLGILQKARLLQVIVIAESFLEHNMPLPLAGLRSWAEQHTVSVQMHCTKNQHKLCAVLPRNVILQAIMHVAVSSLLNVMHIWTALPASYASLALSCVALS